MNRSANSAAPVLPFRSKLPPIRETGSAKVVSHAAFSSAEPLHAWREPVFARLDELCMLGIGWDGYSAPPVSFSNAYFAVSMLTSACPPDTPPPQIVPGPSGDLQIEWHREHGDIELHVTRPNSVRAWRMFQGMPAVEEEFLLTTDFKVVAKWLSELAEASIAARSAAA